MNLVLNRGVGDIIPVNDEIMDDARGCVYSLQEPWQKMKALRQLFVICHAAGKIDLYLKTTEDMRQMPEMTPFRTDVLFFAGSMCEDDCRYDQALEYYLRCLEFDTDNDWIRYNRAVNAAFCYLMKGDPFKAKDHCQDAIVINADNWLAWKNLGMAYEAIDDVREAANCYARAIRLSKGDAGPIVYLRQLIKRRSGQIKNLKTLREDLMEKGVLV